MRAVDQPGWVNEQYKFWRGRVSAGSGPVAVPSPLAQPGTSITPSPGNTTQAVAMSSAVGSQTYVYTVAGASTQPILLVARQPSRSFLTIENNGPGTLVVFFGVNAINSTNASLALSIPNGGTYQARVNVPVDEIYGSTPGVTAAGVIIVGL